MICDNCFAELNEFWSFCPFCGQSPYINPKGVSYEAMRSEVDASEDEGLPEDEDEEEPTPERPLNMEGN